MPPAIEEEIVSRVLELERSIFKIIRRYLIKLAYDVAEANRIPHTFKNDQASKK